MAISPQEVIARRMAEAEEDLLSLPGNIAELLRDKKMWETMAVTLASIRRQPSREGIRKEAGFYQGVMFASWVMTPGWLYAEWETLRDYGDVTEAEALLRLPDDSQ